MNASLSAPVWNWVKITSGDYECQTEHYYFRVKRNDVLKQWALGRRLTPNQPIQLLGLYSTKAGAQEAAMRYAGSL